MDYEWYKTQYFGNLVDETAFNRNIIWATALLDQITFWRLKQIENVPDCVKDALCSAVEKMVLFRKRKEQDLASESNDGYSVSYASAGRLDELKSEVVSDMRTYLSGTGLLYRGWSRVYDLCDT